MDEKKFPCLAALKNPQEIQGYSLAELEILAQDARSFLIDSISRTGGHLGAALGVTELSVALFHCFDFLQDKIAWDVGHQGHVHKILTGRAKDFESYGLWEGMSKFLERKESPYDHMGAGHASTSISSAMGMAQARNLLGEKHHVVAVIGDGAMTGGLAYEALSSAGEQDLDLLVLLNDNGMSIDNNVGAFSQTLTRFTASDVYNLFRTDLKKRAPKMPFGNEVLKSLKHIEHAVKEYLSPGAGLFSALNFRYFGPVDGHNLAKVVPLLKHVKAMKGPRIIHFKTVKGKGLGKDLENTFASHAFAPPKKAQPQHLPQKSWTEIYSEGLQALMAADEKIVALTAAMLSNTGLAPLKKAYPDRVFDVGIAEANAYCSASGMAVGGLKPFVTVYSTFSQRAFDQIVHDIALQHLPVRIMMDRGGFVGNDGPTHHGVFDHSYLRLVPGMVHMAPADEVEFRQMLLTAWLYDKGPIAIRYPRGETPALPLPEPLEPLPVGQGVCLRKAGGQGLLLVAVGSMVAAALQVAHKLEQHGVPVSVLNARFIKPLDETLILEHAEEALGIITLEENVVAGGMGEGIAALLAHHDVLRPLRLLGAPDSFVSYGSQKEQLQASGLLPEQVGQTALALWEEVSPPLLRRPPA